MRTKGVNKFLIEDKNKTENHRARRDHKGFKIKKIVSDVFIVIKLIIIRKNRTLVKCLMNVLTPYDRF